MDAREQLKALIEKYIQYKKRKENREIKWGVNEILDQ